MAKTYFDLQASFPDNLNKDISAGDLRTFVDSQYKLFGGGQKTVLQPPIAVGLTTTPAPIDIIDEVVAGALDIGAVPASNKVAVPVGGAGVYFMTLHLTYDSSSTGHFMGQIFVNDVQVHGTTIIEQVSNNQKGTVNVLLPLVLADADEITMKWWADAGTVNLDILDAMYALLRVGG